MEKKKFWLPIGQLILPVGRASRLQHVAYWLIFAVAIAAIVGLATVVHANALPSFVIAMILLGMYLIFCLLAKRLHDLRVPAIVAFLLVVIPFARGYCEAAAEDGHPILPASWAPALSLAASIWRIVFGFGLIALFVIPGNKGANRYGPDPLDKPPEVF